MIVAAPLTDLAASSTAPDAPYGGDTHRLRQRSGVSSRIRQPSRSRGGLARNRAAHDVFDVAATDADIAELTVRELRQFAHRLSMMAPSVQLL